MQFHKATKEQSKLRMALIGPAGSGKTYSALAIASGLGTKIAVIDTERGSASKYASIFNFDVLQLESFSPTNYIMAIAAAQEAGYDVLIIDSLSHEWNGKDGALEMVDKAAARSTSGNSFAAWRDVTPQHNKLTDAIIGAKCHVISTMRAKTEYVMEPNEKGKIVPRKVGLGPVQRDGQEYEYDIVGELNMKNGLSITKTRCPALSESYTEKPGLELAKTIKDWLTDGIKPQEPAAKPADDLLYKVEAAKARLHAETPLLPAPGPAVAPVEAPKHNPHVLAPLAPQNVEMFNIKGIVENAIEKSGKYGIKIMGKKQHFVTFSQPAYNKALEFKASQKRVELTYTVTLIDEKQQFNLFGIKEEK